MNPVDYWFYYFLPAIIFSGKALALGLCWTMAEASVRRTHWNNNKSKSYPFSFPSIKERLLMMLTPGWICFIASALTSGQTIKGFVNASMVLFGVVMFHAWEESRCPGDYTESTAYSEN